VFQHLKVRNPDRRNIRLRSYGNRSCGPVHSQEGLRPKGAHRIIGIRKFERTGNLDIKKEETPKPETESGKITVKCREPCG
jgi:hypothetical protein